MLQVRWTKEAAPNDLSFLCGNCKLARFESLVSQGREGTGVVTNSLGCALAVSARPESLEAPKNQQNHLKHVASRTLVL